jgi:hypothetical protein
MKKTSFFSRLSRLKTPFVIEPGSPTLTPNVIFLILCKSGVFTLFRSRRVCRKWNDMITNAIVNRVPYFEREIPRLLLQMSRRFCRMTIPYLHHDIVSEVMMSIDHRTAMMSLFRRRMDLPQLIQDYPDVFDSPVMREMLECRKCFCGKQLYPCHLESCPRTDAFCGCMKMAYFPEFSISYCCSDPLCCFYIEFIRSYGLCVCSKDKPCDVTKRLSNHFPWEQRFDLFPSLHAVRE